MNSALRKIGYRLALTIEQRVWPAVAPAVRKLTTPERAAGPGSISIVTVAFNSLDYLRILVATLAAYPDHRVIEVIVVDNGSRDGTRQWLRRQEQLRHVALPINIMHGPALDLGCLLARGETLVVIDVDAFPINPNWINRVIAPLNDPNIALSGGRFEFLGIVFPHPCIAAMRADRFREMRHSWAPIRRHNQLLLDTGCAIAQREWGHFHLLEVTAVRGEGFVGTVFSDAVFHLFYGTRARRSANAELRRVAEAAERVYRDAVLEYHPALERLLPTE